MALRASPGLCPAAPWGLCCRAFSLSVLLLLLLLTWMPFCFISCISSDSSVAIWGDTADVHQTARTTDALVTANTRHSKEITQTS